jgi:hypothetical protein
MAAVAHALDLYTTAGFSVHYKASQALSIPDLELLIYRALAQVLRELPTLFAVPIVAEGAETYFARLPSIDLRKVTSFVQRQKHIPDDSEGRDLELDALLQQQVNTNFKSDQGILPVWRSIVLYDFAEKLQFTANFMVHHAIADGASFQILHRAFHKALHNLSSSHSAMKSQVEYIISSKDDDGIGPPLESIHSLPIPEEAPPTDAPKYNDWLGNLTEMPSKTGYATLTLSSPMVQNFTQDCKKNKVTTPAGLNALITKMIYSNLPSTTESMDVNIPVDIRTDLPPKAVDGVMGNFFDAFRTRIFRSDFCEQDSSELGDIWTAARKVQFDTRKYFSRTAPSGEAYLNIASLKHIPDLQALLKPMIGGPRSESLELAYIGPHVPYSDANLGNKLAWQAGKATVSRCAFALGACLQMTVVLHTEGMTIGFAWPRAAIEEGLVNKTIEGTRDYFVSITEHSI